MGKAPYILILSTCCLVAGLSANLVSKYIRKLGIKALHFEEKDVAEANGYLNPQHTDVMSYQQYLTALV